MITLKSAITIAFIFYSFLSVATSLVICPTQVYCVEREGGYNCQYNIEGWLSEYSDGDYNWPSDGTRPATITFKFSQLKIIPSTPTGYGTATCTMTAEGNSNWFIDYRSTYNQKAATEDKSSNWQNNVCFSSDPSDCPLVQPPPPSGPKLQ